MKKLLVIALAALLALTFFGCEKKGIDIPEISSDDAASDAAYTAALGEFYAYYSEAKASDNLSEKYALMAIAEAKLMEAAVMLPMQANGGVYALSCVAPNTIDYALWGNDNYRYHHAIIATELITAADRAEMKAKWGELKGTGTYHAWAKEYLTGKGYTLKTEYTLLYDEDPSTWDVLGTSMAVDSEPAVNTYDGLMEYDCEGTLQPAIASSYEVSEDGTVYTFHLRNDVKWFNYEGTEIANVTANDFVAGMRHMLDCAEGLEYLIAEGGCIIHNADKYLAGEVTDFAEVGVKAVDDYTVEYTLDAKCDYFLTMLGYGVFAPLNEEFFVAHGGAFGSELDTSAATYTYGTSYENIAYCGPYLVTNHTEKNTIVFTKNPGYYKADEVVLDKIIWKFTTAEDPTEGYNLLKEGVLSGVSLSSTTKPMAIADGLFDKYSYVSSLDANSYPMFFNIMRSAYANSNDETKGVTVLTAEQIERTDAAMSNVHFRRALAFSLDRGGYTAIVYGEDVKYNKLCNTYCPGNFVSLPEEVTVEINGKATTFAAGTFYGEICQAQATADGFQAKLWDPEGDDGIGSSNGFDGWYNPTACVEELKKAAKELGIEISAENPIHIEYPVFTGNAIYKARGEFVKQCIEEASQGAIVIDINGYEVRKEQLYAGYYNATGAEANFTVFDVSGWGPDYGDPCTYLDTMLPYGDGYMTKSLGLY